MTTFYPSFTSLLDVDMPTIAAINGTLSAPVSLAAHVRPACAPPTTPLGMTFVRIGLHPGMLARHSSLVPSRRRGTPSAVQAAILTAGRGTAHGLVNRDVTGDPPSCPKRRPSPNRSRRTRPSTLRYVKEGLRLASRTSGSGLGWEGFAQPVKMATEDVQEGSARYANATAELRGTLSRDDYQFVRGTEKRKVVPPSCWDRPRVGKSAWMICRPMRSRAESRHRTATSARCPRAGSRRPRRTLGTRCDHPPGGDDRTGS